MASTFLRRALILALALPVVLIGLETVRAQVGRPPAIRPPQPPIPQPVIPRPANPQPMNPRPQFPIQPIQQPQPVFPKPPANVGGPIPQPGVNVPQTQVVQVYTCMRCGKRYELPLGSPPPAQCTCGNSGGVVNQAAASPAGGSLSISPTRISIGAIAILVVCAVIALALVAGLILLVLRLSNSGPWAASGRKRRRPAIGYRD